MYSLMLDRILLVRRFFSFDLLRYFLPFRSVDERPHYDLTQNSLYSMNWCCILVHFPKDRETLTLAFSAIWYVLFAAGQASVQRQSGGSREVAFFIGVTCAVLIRLPNNIFQTIRSILFWAYEQPTQLKDQANQLSKSSRDAAVS